MHSIIFYLYLFFFILSPLAVNVVLSMSEVDDLPFVLLTPPLSTNIDLCSSGSSLSSLSSIKLPSLFCWVCSAIPSVVPEVIDLSSSFFLAKDNSTVDSFSPPKR